MSSVSIIQSAKLSRLAGVALGEIRTGTIAGGMSVRTRPAVGLVKQRVVIALAVPVGRGLTGLNASGCIWRRAAARVRWLD